MELNKSQVKKVENYLHEIGIENSLTIDDFLDHLCCMIEQRMHEGFSFEESFDYTINELNYSKIKEIELFTLKLINMETSFSSRTSLLATIPFGLFGIAWAISNSGLGIPSFIEYFMFVASILAMFILLGMGWIKNFPRWSFPAIGFCLFSSICFMMISIPSKDEDLGLWALFPLLITLVISLMFNPTLKPIKQLAQKIKEEPTLLLFALYGFAPFVLFLFYDEMHATWLISTIFLATLILAFGLYTFLRNDKKIIRVMSIILSGLIALIVAYGTSYFYWL